MTSTITLYGNKYLNSKFPLLKEKLFFVDDIESFLPLYKMDEITDFQYIHHQINISIKLNINQSYQTQGAGNRKMYKYVKIVNSDQAYPYYYYVDNVEVISQSCVKLYLSLDTINTCLKANQENTLEFDKKTKVIREHQDRFWVGGDLDTYWIRRIPLQSEGITPILYKTQENILDQFQDGAIGSQSWYLVYRTEYKEGTQPQGQSNPIKCYLLNDEGIKIQATTQTSYSLTIAELKGLLASYGQYGYLTYDIQGNPNVHIRLEDEIDGGQPLDVTIGASKIGIALFPDGDDTDDFISVYVGENDRYMGVLEGIGILRYRRVTISNLTSTQGYLIDVGASVTNTTTNNVLFQSLKFGTPYYLPLRKDIYTIPFTSLDRTDARLVKIICLPYCPIPYTLVNGVFNSPIDWSNEDSMIRIRNINTEFYVDLSKDTDLDDSIKGTLQPCVYARPQSPDPNDERFIKDSKLLHSDFFQKKYIYDSFGYVVKYENIFSRRQPYKDSIISHQGWTYLKYSVSNSISSRMLFDVKPSFIQNLEMMDYDYIFYVARNNEVTMYDSSYLNYLRTGYNFDVKAKNRQEATTWLGVGLGVATSIVGVATGNAPLTFGGVASTIGSLVGAISSTISTEQNLQSKMVTLQNQSASVINADDISLLKVYSDNKVKVEVWRPSGEIQALMDDLFYYFGYLTNMNKIPNVNNRYWFNFLSCDAKFSNSYLWDESIIEDITTKLKIGVTFLHHHNGWDFDQIKENYESWIL